MLEGVAEVAQLLVGVGKILLATRGSSQHMQPVLSRRNHLILAQALVTLAHISQIEADSWG
jgi:hypothetical protein